MLDVGCRGRGGGGCKGGARTDLLLVVVASGGGGICGGAVVGRPGSFVVDVVTPVALDGARDKLARLVERADGIGGGGGSRLSRSGLLEIAGGGLRS